MQRAGRRVGRSKRSLRNFKNDELIVPAVARTRRTLTIRNATGRAGARTKYNVPRLRTWQRQVRGEEFQAAHAGYDACRVSGFDRFLRTAHSANHVVVGHHRPTIAILSGSPGRRISQSRSNMKLASAIAPVPAMLAAGVAVGLGTDGAANTRPRHVRSHALAAFLHKVNSGDSEHDSRFNGARDGHYQWCQSAGEGETARLARDSKRADLRGVVAGARRLLFICGLSH